MNRMFERFRLVLIHEMVYPDGEVHQIGKPYCAVYSADRINGKSPILLNAMLDRFKDEIIAMAERGEQDG